MIDAHFRRLRTAAEIGPDDEAAVRSLIVDIETFAPNVEIGIADHPRGNCMLLLDGWAARSQSCDDKPRQILGIAIAGDFADLHSLTLRRLDHDVVSLTRCRVALIPHERLRSFLWNTPRFAELYLHWTNVDSAVQRRWSLCLGSKSSICRIAHLFCEMYVRLEVVGKVRGHSCDFPLTQVQIGECAGITSVHVNRVVQELRASGLVSLAQGTLTIHNFEALATVAKFDPAYLDAGERHPPEAARAGSNSQTASPHHCAAEQINHLEFSGVQR